MSERLSDGVVETLAHGRDQCATLAREVQERRAEERPISTSERLPSIDERVLIWDGEEWLMASYCGPDAHWGWDLDTWFMSLEDVRFWLPLPPAPSETTP